MFRLLLLFYLFFSVLNMNTGCLLWEDWVEPLFLFSDCRLKCLAASAQACIYLQGNVLIFFSLAKFFHWAQCSYSILHGLVRTTVLWFELNESLKFFVIVYYTSILTCRCMCIWTFWVCMEGLRFVILALLFYPVSVCIFCESQSHVTQQYCIYTTPGLLNCGLVE